MNNNSILILGAGIYQLGLIEKAKALGYVVHVASRAGNYPGIPLADVFHEVDTTDREGVLSICREINPVFVISSGSDVCMPAIGYVNDTLELPGVSRTAAEIMSSKGKFRQFQMANGIDYPKFHHTSSVDDAWNWYLEQGRDVLIKPCMSSGSRGVFKVDSGTAYETFEREFKIAVECSKLGDVCLEAFLPGHEIGGNAILQDGECKLLVVSRKYLNGFLVLGHEYPTDLNSSALNNVRKTLEDCCRKLGYADGALNFDMMVDGDIARIIELGARFGGNGLVDLCLASYEIDLESCLLESFTGAEINAVGSRVRHCGSFVFGAERTGKLSNIATLDELRENCPWVRKLVVQRKVGEDVDALVSNADIIGYAIFDIPDGMTWQECSMSILNNLAIKVEA